ncbi:hypothetical protein R3W88_017163 [Solanum pinnatisectum]|uniref:Fucosyltransferase n=1 Tax=Solanum pinnatisectum TaxID=50273 RepID=A0AAV9KZE8_9SOLN|nr:hypothetical protein R3W88_017163 [Solanum pinnatisectum]
MAQNPLKFIGFLIICGMFLTILLTASVIFKDLPSDSVKNLPKSNIVDVKPPNAIVNSQVQKDKLLGGLLPSGIDETSCLSRYESALYHKELLHKPSSYLISRLRDYEVLHKQCGPHTESYNRSVELIKSGQYNGSAHFLLVDPGVNMPRLFCEPFQDISWLIPPDFPLFNQFSTFDQKSPRSYGYMVKHDVISNSSTLPPYIYLHLANDYDDQDKLFFCDEDQSFIKKIPWLVMKTNTYFVPSLFLIPSFEQELSYFTIFPEKVTIFYFLRGLVKRYYQAYLARADEKLGIQIRVLETDAGPFKYVLDQIIDCTMKENLLPQVNRSSEPMDFNQSTKQRKTISVLITSLSPGYSEEFRKMYWENLTVTGEIVSVYQPSQEEYQQSENLLHEKKALAEMYLLSLSDKLGHGGLKPWILYKPNENRTAHNPPCVRAESFEPCFHAPPNYDCKKKTPTDTSKIVPRIRHCEDVSWGLKLFD